jgi:cell division protein FtsW
VALDVSEAPPSADPSEPSLEPSDLAPPRRGGSLRPQPMDPWLFLAVIALCALGLVMVYSGSAWLGHEVFDDWEYFLHRQAVFLVVGITGMLVLSRIDYRLLRRFAPHLMLAALVMLLLVLLLGQEINGARRWIRFGPVGIQPSETQHLLWSTERWTL